MDIKNVLVPTDFSDMSLKAIDYAHQLALKMGAKLHVLHVVEPAPVVTPEMGVTLVPTADPRHVEEMQAGLRRVAHQLEGANLVEIVRTGHPATQIVEYADTHDIDLIVMSTHGRRGVARLVLGSTTESVVRTANCPVLSIRDKHEK